MLRVRTRYLPVAYATSNRYAATESLKPRMAATKAMDDSRSTATEVCISGAAAAA